jgi:integrase
MRSRINMGSVVQDKRDKIWRFYWWESGKRRSKALGGFRTKAAAWSAAKPLREEVESKASVGAPAAPTVISLIERYRTERMPTRIDTKRTYEAWTPWSYDQVWRVYQKAGKAAGIGGLGTHSLRHTFRTWLGSVGTPVGVQPRLMRHSDIRTTMNIYGDAFTPDMAEAQNKIVDLALNGTGSGLTC